jgi:outer membrane protein assembly factor BamE (lipoprotein component of BamABCDE complex)
MRILLLVACLFIAGCGSQTSFDQERWLQADLATRERAHMVAGLLDAHPLKSMNRTEVVELLGSPTPTDKWDGTEMIYVLGPDAGMALTMSGF